MLDSNRQWSTGQWVVRENWLTKKPGTEALSISLITSLLLALGALLAWSPLDIFSNLMPLSREGLLQNHQYWRLWSTLFVHGDLKHLVSNLFYFSILGYFLSSYFGLFAFPFLSFFAGGIVNLLVINRLPEQVQLIGASGVVFWMGGFWLTLYLFLETRRSWTQRIIRALGVGLSIFMPTEAFDPHISYQSHFFGFILGILFALIFYFVNRKTFSVAIVNEYIKDTNEPITEK